MNKSTVAGPIEVTRYKNLYTWLHPVCDKLINILIAGKQLCLRLISKFKETPWFVSIVISALDWRLNKLLYIVLTTIG